MPGPSTQTKVRVALTLSDLEQMETLFAAAGADTSKHAFHYNEADNRWELWEVDLTTGALRGKLQLDVNDTNWEAAA